MKNNQNIIIVLLVIGLAYLGYSLNDTRNELKKYKDRYKSVSIKYIQEIIDPPLLEKPDNEDMQTTTVDFSSNILEFENLDGQSYTLNDFKNKVLFINYWATWCNPCLAEMPQMAELYKKYENNNEIAFLYLSKEEKQVIKNYLPKDENLQKLPLYKIITDDELFATRGIPTTFIINKDGEIVVKDVGSALWNDSSVEDFLNSIL